uniref:Short-chain dehydrogenase/reductase-like protein n=1 Tax=Adineta vaga TaxID=104782 RepID=B3G473_ADIVA|nr:short-chain dehydrogenase/reductase-like protein [Adineta vaga]
MGKLDGKIALITGGSEGIGFAIAQQFITENAEHVFITGRRQDMLDEAIAKMGSRNVTAVQGDVSNMFDLDTLYDIILREKGRLNIVVANAGISPIAPLGSINESEFDETFNINVKGVLFTVQKALPLLVDGAAIILIGSVSSIKGHPSASVYSASKAAVRSFARCWTADLKHRNIRVNTLSPGSIETAMFKRVASSEGMKPTFVSDMISSIPMGRFCTTDETAKSAVFLASDDSSYITGIELFVDGGRGQV